MVTHTNLMIYSPLNFEFRFFSSLMEIAATFDCLISIRQKYKWLISNISFWLVVSSSIVFSFGYHVYTFFQFSVGIRYTNTTVNGSVTQSSYYYQKQSSFRFSQVSLNLLTAEALIRDVVFLVILIILNFFILLELKRVTKRRIEMSTSTHESAHSVTGTRPPRDKNVQLAMSAERKKAFMIVATGLSFLLGHSLLAAFQIATSLFNVSFMTEQSWMCIFNLGNELILISYGISFFLYYAFNTQFRKYVKQDIGILLFPIIKLKQIIFGR